MNQQNTPLLKKMEETTISLKANQIYKRMKVKTNLSITNNPSKNSKSCLMS